MEECIDGWRRGCTWRADGWMDEWMDRQTDERIEVGNYVRMYV